MAQTTPDQFGHIVIEGDGGSVAGMAATLDPASTAQPVLDQALRYGAALGYAKYVHGRTAVAPTPTLVSKTMSDTRNFVLGREFPQFTRRAFTGGVPAAFRAALTAAFEEYRL